MRSEVQKVVLIGCSAGALEALNQILPLLPKDFTWPVIIVVHVPPDRDSKIVEIFRSRCQMQVKEAEDKELIQPGVIYFAPRDYHLLIEKDFVFSLSSDEIVNFSRPSIDVLFESAADAYRNRVLGVILTGASSDGSKGLKAVTDKNGQAIVQQSQSAYASIMPKAAEMCCPEAEIVELEEIVDQILQHYQSHRQSHR